MFWILWATLAGLTLSWFALRPALRESRRAWNAPLPRRHERALTGASCENCSSDDFVKGESGQMVCAACGSAADLQHPT